MHVHRYTSLADSNPVQQEERSSTGQPTLVMFAQDLSIHVGAGGSLLSICCLCTHRWARLPLTVNSALLLAEPGHRELQKSRSFGVNEYSTTVLLELLSAEVQNVPWELLAIWPQGFQPSSSYSGLHDPHWVQDRWVTSWRRTFPRSCQVDYRGVTAYER